MLGQVNRTERALLPAAVDDYVEAGHPARFFVALIERMDLSAFEGEYRLDHGRPGYPPAMLLTLWLYGYANGVNSSRALERATRKDLEFMYIAGGATPDHTTLATFRRRFETAFRQVGAQALELARQAELLAPDTLALDGTKLKASAAQEKTANAKSIAKRIERYERLLDEQLAASARQDEAAAGGVAHGEAVDGDDVQAMIDALNAKLKTHRRVQAELTAADEARHQERQAVHDAKVFKRESQLAETGKLPRGRPPKEPPAEPEALTRTHLTDPEASLMKTRDGIRPAYNAQAGVDADTMLVLTADVTTAANDKQQLQPTLDAIEALPDGMTPDVLLADAGYYSDANVQACAAAAVEPYIPPGRKLSTKPKGARSAAVDAMVDRLQTDAGRTRYGRRKSTVETVFGVIKAAMGFGQLRLRGLDGAKTEWDLACFAWNLKRMHTLWGTSLT